MAPRRGFEEITVKPLGAQSGRERFPRKYVRDHDIEVPRCASWGMNLTALSQIYNMYICAYGDKIHIYKPTGPQQLLTTDPLLSIDLPSTPTAKRIRHDDPFSTHTINHLIVGNLGTREILLCACADGDVAAYYTTPLYRASNHPSSRSPNATTAPTPLSPPAPFFHENVSISAWGLAIHSRSRLLAVSSNRHEVQVFAFALNNPSPSTAPPSAPPSSSPPPRHSHSDSSDIEFDFDSEFGSDSDGGPATFPERSPFLPAPTSRSSNFRLRLRLGPEGDNIPSIAFTSDPSGEASMVIASDIRGALWFLPLWSVTTPMRIPTVPWGVNVRREPQGWGVLVLGERFGMGAGGLEEAFGCEPRVGEEGWMDISASVPEVRDSTVWRMDDRERMGPIGDMAVNEMLDVILDEMDVDGEGEDDDEEEGDMDFELYDHDGDDEDGDEDDENNDDEDEDEEDEEDDEDDSENDSENDSESASDTSHHSHSPNCPYRTRPLPLPPHHLLMHLNRHSLTLHPPTGPRTFCSRLLRQDFSHALPRTFPHAMAFYNRLNMAVPVPGISVVLVASQVGRVGVVRVIRGGAEGVGREKAGDGGSGSNGENEGQGKNGCHGGNGGHGGNGTHGGKGAKREREEGGEKKNEPAASMRIEAILPLSSQEGPGGARPTTGLHGVAVSPMPDWLPGREMTSSSLDEDGRPADTSAELVGRKRRRGVKRWRVMLQFWDLSVMSYVLSDERALGVEGF